MYISIYLSILRMTECSLALTVNRTNKKKKKKRKTKKKKKINDWKKVRCERERKSSTHLLMIEKCIFLNDSQISSMHRQMIVLKERQRITMTVKEIIHILLFFCFSAHTNNLIRRAAKKYRMEKEMKQMCREKNPEIYRTEKIRHYSNISTIIKD